MTPITFTVKRSVYNLSDNVTSDTRMLYDMETLKGGRIFEYNIAGCRTFEGLLQVLITNLEVERDIMLELFKTFGETTIPGFRPKLEEVLCIFDEQKSGEKTVSPLTINAMTGQELLAKHELVLAGIRVLKKEVEKIKAPIPMDELFEQEWEL